MITKLNSRVNLLKRARKYLNLSLRNLLYNALIKPMFEYCCSVWGNTKIDNLQRLLIIQKRCARVILNAGTERSVGLFKRLGWIPISDIIEQRKLCIMHNIIHGKCPDYFIIILVMLKIDIVSDIIEQRKLCIMHNIIHGKCPDYFIIIFVMLKIDIVTQLGRQLIWTYTHLSLAL